VLRALWWPGGYALCSPPQLCSLLGVCSMMFRGDGEMAANVLAALPVSSVSDKSFWILGVKMEPGSSRRDIEGQEAMSRDTGNAGWV